MRKTHLIHPTFEWVDLGGFMSGSNRKQGRKRPDEPFIERTINIIDQWNPKTIFAKNEPLILKSNPQKSEEGQKCDETSQIIEQIANLRRDQKDNAEKIADLQKAFLVRMINFEDPKFVAILKHKINEELSSTQNPQIEQPELYEMLRTLKMQAEAREANKKQQVEDEELESKFSIRRRGSSSS